MLLSQRLISQLNLPPASQIHAPTHDLFRVQTSSGKVVATSFPYLTVHRWLAGDILVYLAFISSNWLFQTAQEAI